MYILIISIIRIEIFLRSREYMSETRTYRPAGNKTSFQKRRPQQNNHRRGGGPAKRAVKKFDPSAFIKVVEPHTTVA